MAIKARDRSKGAEKLDGGKVKGLMVKNHIQWLRDNHGKKSVDQVISSLEEEIGRDLRNVLASNWYPFRELMALDDAIIAQFGDGNPGYARNFGAYSARAALTSTYRVFKREDFHDFLERSAPLHSQFQDFGSVEFEKLSDSGARMEHVGYPCYSPIYCESALGYFEEAARIHGIENPIVSETECQTEGGSSCSFEITW